MIDYTFGVLLFICVIVVVSLFGPTKVFEVLFFIFLFAAACKQKNQRVTMPDRVSLGRFIVMIGSAVLIALGQLR